MNAFDEVSKKLDNMLSGDEKQAVAVQATSAQLVLGQREEAVVQLLQPLKVLPPVGLGLREQARRWKVVVVLAAARTTVGVARAHVERRPLAGLVVDALGLEHLDSRG